METVEGERERESHLLSFSGCWGAEDGGMNDFLLYLYSSSLSSRSSFPISYFSYALRHSLGQQPEALFRYNSIVSP